MNTIPYGRGENDKNRITLLRDKHRSNNDSAAGVESSRSSTESVPFKDPSGNLHPGHAGRRHEASWGTERRQRRADLSALSLGELLDDVESTAVAVPAIYPLLTPVCSSAWGIGDMATIPSRKNAGKSHEAIPGVLEF